MTSHPTPLVSILTPSYNQGRFIRDTIESVLGQDYPAIEHIIVDGGSTDGTLDVIRKYSANIKLVSEPDRGQADALNKAFAFSRGSIIGWLNSDDFYVARDVVSCVVGEFAVSPTPDVVYGHALWVDAGNRVLKVSRRPHFDRERLQRFDYIAQPAAFFRKGATQAPLVDPALDFALDYALWLELAERDARFVRLDRPLAAMRRHRDAKSVKAHAALQGESLTLRARRRQQPTSRLVAGDVSLMLRLKLHGLASFGRRPLRVADSPVELSLPPLASRLFYQLGLAGSRGTPLLLLRELRELATARRSGAPEGNA